MKMQKCLHLKDAKKVKNFAIISPYAVMEKKDGWYMTIDLIDGKWLGLTSSAERIIPSMLSMSRRFEEIKTEIFKGKNLRFIFEGTVPELDFFTMNGLFNRKYEQVTNAQLHLHDVIDLDNPTKLDFRARYLLARELIKPLQDCFSEQTQLLPIIEETTSEIVVFKEFEKIIYQGGEGIVAKQLNASYAPGKRNSTMLKLKAEIEKDVLVVSFKMGAGKYCNTVGALVCKRKNGTTFTVSGMSDEQRNSWWENPSLILKKVIKVRAMSEHGDGMLYQPRFNLIRHDKNPEDID